MRELKDVDATIPHSCVNTSRFDDVSRMSSRDVVRELVAMVGSRMVAYIGGVHHTKFVQAWANGTSTPQRQAALRTALQAARLIVADSPNVVDLWFMGANTYLDREAPAAVLRIGSGSAAFARVVRAAKSFTL